MDSSTKPSHLISLILLTVYFLKAWIKKVVSDKKSVSEVSLTYIKTSRYLNRELLMYCNNYLRFKRNVQPRVFYLSSSLHPLPTHSLGSMLRQASLPSVLRQLLLLVQLKALMLLRLVLIKVVKIGAQICSITLRKKEFPQITTKNLILNILADLKMWWRL